MLLEFILNALLISTETILITFALLNNNITNYSLTVGVEPSLHSWSKSCLVCIFFHNTLLALIYLLYFRLFVSIFITEIWLCFFLPSLLVFGIWFLPICSEELKCFPSFCCLDQINSKDAILYLKILPSCPYIHLGAVFFWGILLYIRSLFHHLWNIYLTFIPLNAFCLHSTLSTLKLLYL